MAVRLGGRVFLGGLVGVAIAAALSARLVSPEPNPADDWHLVVLGIAQDGGIPQLGCEEPICVAIRSGQRKPERVASIGLINPTLKRAYLIDATPDFVSQVDSLTGGRLPDGILLTHAHIGHYTGLMYLGREAVDAKHVPVWGTERMRAFLTNNGPWSLLVTRQNIDLHDLSPGQPTSLGDGLTVTAYPVPHRDEFTDTVGFLIEGPHKKVLYIPDIDGWDQWSRDIRQMVDRVDVAFLDGTFASADELPGRPMAEIPHPLMPITRELLRGTRARVWFIHLNHTNKEIDAPDVARDGMSFAM
ncbi:MAG TPA: MBL fold metallo-hydrolase [Vicinamibacterales bacterium]